MPNLNKACSSKFITLKSLRNLRPWFKDAASDDVQDVINQLEKLKREKLQEEEDRRASILCEQELHQTNKVQLSNNQLQSAFDPQDILDALIDRFSCRSRRYRSARVKYRYFDLQGNLCEWSGQGREPIKLRELLLATGKSRDDFLVKDDESSEAMNLNNALSNVTDAPVNVVTQDVCISLQENFAFNTNTNNKKDVNKLLKAIIDTENAHQAQDDNASLVSKDSA